MDDFSRSINIGRPVAPSYVNGETRLRWSLEWRYLCSKIPNEDFAPEERDTEDDHDAHFLLTPEEAKLLWKPPPLDLPTMKKDILQQMVAYEGNVGRYIRLTDRQTREEMEFTEHICVIRGIHYNTMFARWWSEKLETDHIIWTTGRHPQAINDHRIMI
jgi:hypothetical protein